MTPKKFIYCAVNQFDRNQKIFLLEGTTLTSLGSIHIEDLAATLPGICYAKAIYNVKLVGSPKFLEPYVKKIKTPEAQQYGFNKIEIGVEEQ